MVKAMTEKIYVLLGHIELIIHKIVRYGCFVGMVTLLIMMLLTSSDIFGRGVFNHPISGTYEVTQYMLAVVVLLGLGYVQQTDRMVRVTMFYDKMPLGVRWCLNSVFHILAIIFFSLVVWQGFIESLSAFHLNKISDILHIPAYPFEFLVPLGALLLIAELIISLLKKLKEFPKGILIKSSGTKEMVE